MMENIKEASDYVGLEIELQTEEMRGMDIEALVQVILVRTYGTVGETQLEYEVRNLGNKKQGDLLIQTAFMKVHRRDKEKIWGSLAWYGGNELHKQKFVLTESL
eukprot:TRINITY_DN22542_c0_g1_i1.p1 TRINITY_DN22542_c0_g1~~TRINITY_DN22542_c0_g1_i1.p1  ORF type:complete len:104 (+),score=32.57 TRINITY_DN22542_c0_g1_i1:102-413(+)